MAAASGLKPFETDSMSPVDVEINVEGWEKNRRIDWEIGRAICYNAAVFGNSDPKKMKGPQKFMPFPWDVEEKEADIVEGMTRRQQAILALHAQRKARRERLEKLKND